MNFADYPKSLSEIAADKADDCRKWTPRDLLISLLRQIDSGEQKPVSLVIVGLEKDEDGSDVSSLWLSQASKTLAVGMLTRAAMTIDGA